MELLSPAGSFDSLRAAVQNGADAVYLGGADFNARRFAENFADLEEAVSYAHLRGCAMHFTLNTLLPDRDLKKWAQTAADAARAGVDAFLVQDLGGLSILKRMCPDIPLHASTQMTIHNTEGARAMKELGFSRVVLARELSAGQIRAIRRSVDIELEAFCHGALCVCYSGQCLMSSMLGGRSANRGECAQPCRLRYRLGDKSGYLLSPKDLCLADELHALRSAGVCSVKIEGRMKRPEYVAAVTGVYRKALDGAPLSEADREALLLAFNRGGFTRGLFAGDPDRLYPKQPGHIGIPAGKTLAVRGNTVTIQTKRALLPGDEIAPAAAEAARQKILRSVQTDGGYAVRVPDAAAFRPGMGVNLVADARQNAALLASLRENRRRTPLRARIELAPGRPAALFVQEPGGVSAAVLGGVAEPARTRALTREDVLRQLQKTGDAPFAFQTADVDLAEGCAFPTSGLNDLRRRALAALSEKMLAARKDRAVFPYTPIARVERPRPTPRLAVQVRTREQLEAAAAFADLLYLPLDAAFDPPAGTEAAGVYPRIVSDREHMAVRPLEQRFSSVLTNGFLATGRKKIADSGMNAANSEALALLASLGYMRVTLSQELNAAQIGALCVPPGLETESIVYGRTTLMVTQHCPVCCGRKGCVVAGGTAFLTDRKGMRFPLVPAGGDCRVAILNAVPVYMADRLDTLSADVFRLQFTVEGPEECEKIARAYRAAVDGIPFENPVTNYTRGHFNRGI